MYTIFDYLKYYKNKKISDVHWNAQDMLLCAILTYTPVESYHGAKSLEEFVQYAYSYFDEPKENAFVSDVYEILDIIRDSKRYRELRIINFENIRNEETQFGAATFQIRKQATVAYKGTDYSLIGWLENFRLAYEYPTFSHSLAIEYLKNTISVVDYKELYVCGHSKGGNLALVAAMETSEEVFDKLKKVYNFDGPGLRKDEFAQKKLDRITKKLVNIVPSASVVGVLLYNTKYTVVKSKRVGIYEHYPTTWNIFGECFVEGKLSNISAKVHESTTKGIESLEYEKMREAFEYIFQSFGIEYSSIVKLSAEDIVRFYGNVKNIDPEVKKSIDCIIGTVLQPGLGIGRKEKYE